MTLNIFVSGQSNAIGRNAGGEPLENVDCRCKFWNNVASLGGQGNAFVAPETGEPPFDPTANGNNFGAWFADKAVRFFNTDTKSVQVYRGGMGIRAWDQPHRGDYDLYEECLAVYAKSGQPPADVMLWHQGETDADDLDNTSTKNYKSQFLDMVCRLRRDGVIAESAPVIIGKLARAGTADINQALDELAAENDFIHIVEIDGLSTDDGTHFTGPSLVELGERYFEAYKDYIRTMTDVPGRVINTSDEVAPPPPATGPITYIDKWVLPDNQSSHTVDVGGKSVEFILSGVSTRCMLVAWEHDETDLILGVVSYGQTVTSLTIDSVPVTEIVEAAGDAGSTLVNAAIYSNVTANDFAFDTGTKVLSASASVPVEGGAVAVAACWTSDNPFNSITGEDFNTEIETTNFKGAGGHINSELGGTQQFTADFDAVADNRSSLVVASF